MASQSEISNLPTYEQILERVKAQYWGHVFNQWSVDYKTYYCECGKIKGDDDDNECPVRIAQAIQTATVEALRVASRMSCGVCYSLVCTHSVYLREAANALEKGLTK